MRRIFVVSNAIQTIDNETAYLIYCLNCIRHGENSTYETGLSSLCYANKDQAFSPTPRPPPPPNIIFLCHRDRNGWITQVVSLTTQVKCHLLAPFYAPNVRRGECNSNNG